MQNSALKSFFDLTVHYEALLVRRELICPVLWPENRTFPTERLMYYYVRLSQNARNSLSDAFYIIDSDFNITTEDNAVQTISGSSFPDNINHGLPGTPHFYVRNFYSDKKNVQPHIMKTRATFRTSDIQISTDIQISPSR